MDKLEHIMRVLLDPRVLNSLQFASVGMEAILEKYAEIPAYKEILTETIEDLDKVIFLIKQLQEGYLK